MEIDFETEYDGDIPDLEEAYHLFGDTDEHLFAEMEVEEGTDLYLLDFEEGQVTELPYTERERFRSKGITAWQIGENEYGIEALLNPSVEEVNEEDKRPERYMEDPVENSPLNERLEGETRLEDLPNPFAAWVSGRRGLEDALSSEYGKTYVSRGEGI